MVSRVLSRCTQLGLVTWINSSVTQCSTLTPPSTEILQDLPEHIVPLKLGYCQVYLIGTNHVSQGSVADVQKIVSVVKPDLVFLELCQQRRGVLTRKELRNPTTKEIVAATMKHLKDDNTFLAFLSGIEQLKAREVKVVPGSEFRIAYEEAIKYGGKVVLGDRSREVTMKRAMRKITLSEIMKGFFLPLPTDESSPPSSETLVKWVKEFEYHNMDAVNRKTQELIKRFPTWAEVVVHERDIFMAKGILNVAKESSCVVVVVGMGHLEGIKKHLQHQRQLDELSVNDLSTIPPPKHAAKIIISVGVLMAGVAIVWKCFK
ncbi:hypothetical protein PIB30_021216 [Stylosanthes scabra]|uniref:TraB domain-containing protein-like n=1 Tax=Stylosanthes scabra TaxID=79078 RepID=A0ABU6V7S4_9FABA|nr:hypothetical protein [Stylosanthes scabra]